MTRLVLYPRSGLGGKIFVLGSIRFNRESIYSRFLHNVLVNRACQRHTGKTQNGFAEEVLEYILPVRFRYSSGWVLVQGVVDAKADGCAIKEI